MDSFYALLMSLSFVSCLVVVAFVWRRRNKPGALPVFAFMLALAQWSLSYAIHWLVTQPQQRWFWLNVTYFGAVAVPTAFFLFALIYTHREKWVTRRLLSGLMAPPVVVLLLLWSDEAHGLFFGGKRAPNATMFLEGGPGFWLNIGYSYLLILIGFVLLLQMFFQVRQPYRRQVGVILLGASLPWLSNMLSLAGVRPPGLDLTPVFFVLTGVIFTIGLFRTGLLDLAPVARSRLIETMADGVLVLDTADRIVDINPSAARLFGQSQEALIGQPLDALFALWPDELTRLRHLMGGREEVQVGGQSSRYFEVQIVPLYDGRQRLTGRLITWRDISERKKAELEREQLIHELNAYAHTVAHDLKTPLALTIGYGEMLAEIIPPAAEENRQAFFLARIQASSHQMLRIVDELLMLATIRGQEHIPLEPLSMSVWVQSALDRLEMVIQESQAVISLPEQWPLAMGYGPWIEEVWANYISNALKYGGKPPRVTLGCDLLPTGMVRFWVKDNGPGLNQAAQQRLFQEFERLDRQQTEGHGLGLSVARRILERLGGAVGVES
ncbi:MAG: PAS domain-containing protein, partial [Anaerolinea sp.]|nr:PAS domain-containing protein [Anaerolinea sp.]